LAGEVESVGKQVTRFKKGDRIVASTGMAGGGHAEYACVAENGALALKADSLSWEEAVAIPFGANTALYFLENLGKIQPGQKLLIIGASGSIGSAAVQLAKHFGATVTAVCSGANTQMLATDWAAVAGVPADVVKAGTGISGLYDLEPIRLCYLNDVLALTRDDARFRLANCGTLVRDEDRVARPASVQAGAHPRDFHDKSVEAETLFELPVVPRRPDGQGSAGTKCGKCSGNAGIVVESCVVGGRERPRAVVRVQEHDVKATGVRPQRETHIRSLDPDARIP
jgi:hypothetical protein